MNYQQADAAIKQYFAQQWNNATAVVYDDDKNFTPPNSATWLRVNVKMVDGTQASTGAPGSNKFRKTGIVTVSVFHPDGHGGIQAMQTADLVVNIFEAKPRINGVLFNNVRAVNVGPDGAGWYQINVKAEFQFDTTK